MKRSRIFLGVTTSLLAIAGVVAAKTRNPVQATNYYKDKDSQCQPYKFTHCLNANSGDQCYYVTTGLTKLTLYTDSQCSSISFYNID